MQTNTSDAIYNSSLNNSSLNRRQFTRLRHNLSTTQKKYEAKQASRHLNKLCSILPKQAKIGIYYDDFGELPTQIILDWAIKVDYQVHLPIIDKGLSIKGKKLKFSPVLYAKLHNLPTSVHKLGMRQHRHRLQLSATHMDVIFCPLVAVDNLGTRVGMGGGYYDRTLAKSLQFIHKSPIKIGWCYDFQVVNDQKIKRNVWDVPMDIIITPTQFLVI